MIKTHIAIISYLFIFYLLSFISSRYHGKECITTSSAVSNFILPPRGSVLSPPIPLILHGERGTECSEELVSEIGSGSNFTVDIVSTLTLEVGGYSSKIDYVQKNVTVISFFWKRNFLVFIFNLIIKYTCLKPLLLSAFMIIIIFIFKFIILSKTIFKYSILNFKFKLKKKKNELNVRDVLNAKVAEVFEILLV